MLVDIFNQRPFNAVELTGVINDIPYVPGMLGQMGERLFPTSRVRTRQVAVYKDSGRFSLVPVSAIGAPPVELERKTGFLRDFRTRRLAKGSTIMAEDFTGILQAPEAVQLATMQGEVVIRGQQIRDDIELTHEHMRMGAVFGKVLDADGTTVLDDWFANWGVTEPVPVNFALTTPTTDVWLKSKQVSDQMRDAGRGGWVVGQTEVHALCGSNFYNRLITHPTVVDTYKGWSAAADLRGDARFSQFVYGNVVYHDWRGADDSTTFDINDDQAWFFPVGGRQVFQRILGPSEFMPFINQPGQEIYAMTIADRERGAFQRVEAYNYPLYVCTRPEMLQKAVAS